MKIGTFLCCGVSFLAAVSADIAIAQTAEQARVEDSGIQDIVVTATRRAERLQNVPISVSALSGNRLETQQVGDVTALAKVVPGMQVRQSVTPLQTSVAIRGVTQLGTQIASDPPVGTYVDGVYNVVNAGSNVAMIDMERVEVLKGPQGTLFGRNTIGGAISITTHEPTDQLEGMIKVDGGNYGALGITGILNLPVVPGLLDTRFVYAHSQHDGYGRNFTTGNPTNSYNQEFARGSMKFTSEGGFELLATGAYIDARGYSPPFKLGFFPTTSPFNAAYPAAAGRAGDLISNYIDAGGDQDVYANIDSTFALKQYSASLTATAELGDGLSVKSITGYNRTRYRQTIDLDGSPYSLLDNPLHPVRASQVSQEVQAYGDLADGRLKYIAGAYYFQVKGSQLPYTAALPLLTPAAARQLNIAGPYVHNRSYSAFAQMTYNITDAVRLTGGVRYVVDKRRVEYRDYQQPLASPPGVGFTRCVLPTSPGGTNPAACILTDKVKYNFVPFTVGLDFKPSEDMLLYAKFSRGYRSGAYSNSAPTAVFPSATVTAAQAAAANQLIVSQFGPVRPETLVSPEMGGKFSLLDRRLRINMAAYYSKYDNLQVQVPLPPACTTCATRSVLSNSGSVEIYGGEFELTALLGRLQIDAGLGYTHPKYTRGSPSFGTAVASVSKLNANIGAELPVETSAGTLTFNGTYSYRSKMYLLQPVVGAAPGQNLDSIQKGFGLFDARATLAIADTPISFAIYGQNLANKTYRVSVTSIGAPLNFASYVPGAPRTFGGSVTVKF